MEARGGPLPPAAVGRVVEPMHADEVAACEEMVVDLFGEPFRFAAPAHAVERFEPCAGPLVEVGDRTRNLGLDETGTACRGIVARCGKPTGRPEIVEVVERLFTSPHIVAAVDQSARVVPVEDGLEIALFGQCHHHVAVIETDLGRDVADVVLQGCQVGKDVVAFPVPELGRHIFGPRKDRERVEELVLEEVVHAVAPLLVHVLFETVEIDLDQLFPVVGVQQVVGLRGRDIDGIGLGRGGSCPGQFSGTGGGGEIDRFLFLVVFRQGDDADRMFGKCEGESRSGGHRMGRDVEFALVIFVLWLVVYLIGIVAVPVPAYRIVVQAQAHAPIGTGA